MIRSGLRSGRRYTIVPRCHRPSKRCPSSNDSCSPARTWRRSVCNGRVSHAQGRTEERRGYARGKQRKSWKDARKVRSQERGAPHGPRGSGWGVLWVLRRVRPLALSLVAYLASLVPSEAQLSHPHLSPLHAKSQGPYAYRPGHAARSDRASVTSTSGRTSASKCARRWPLVCVLTWDKPRADQQIAEGWLSSTGCERCARWASKAEPAPRLSDEPLQ